MLQESLDLRAEADELHAFLQTLAAPDWSRPTPFLSWTPWDVVAHLHVTDRLALFALTDAESYAAKLGELVRAFAEGVSGAELARRELGVLEPAALMSQWHRSCHDLAERLGVCDPKRRVPWVGPDMGVRMFTTARYMETWAHGQDVYDLKQVRRVHTDRIRHIAVLGVKTFGWSFANRGLEVPGDPPYVELAAPSGAIWKWNEPSDANRIAGDAVDFCHVVTQGRNVADTGLEVRGETASRWMAIAQCFAGAPVDPPKPGERCGSEGAHERRRARGEG